MMMDTDAAMRPPAYDDNADASRPGFVLLEQFAYFSDRRNVTTASCDMRGPNLKGSIQVTLCSAHPPKVSYFCVHTAAFHPAEFAIEPKILATDGPLALIRVTICPPEYFIYHAGNPSEGMDPWLKHLPHPRPCVFEESSLSIVRHCSRGRALRPHGTSLPPYGDSQEAHGTSLPPYGDSQEDHDCSDCNYVIVALRRRFGRKVSYELCLYHSENEGWCTLPVLAEDNASHHGKTRKAINIGGGTVAWVDLCRDIIFCNVLAITASSPPQLRCLNLPPRIKATKGTPGYAGDIVAINGFIAYTELQVPILDPDSPVDDGSLNWKATKWSIKIPDLLAAKSFWQQDCELDSTDISSKLQGYDKSLPALQRLHIGLPSMSLQDDGIVYILAKSNPEDRCGKTWVLVVDMKHKTLQEVAEFGTPRFVDLGLEAFVSSRISEYIEVTPGAKRNSKRQKMLSHEQQPEIFMVADVPFLPGQPQSQEPEVEGVSKGAECLEDMVFEFLPVEPQSEEEPEVEGVSKGAECSADMVLEFLPFESQSQQEAQVRGADLWEDIGLENGVVFLPVKPQSQQETEIEVAGNGAEFCENTVFLPLTQEEQVDWARQVAEILASKGAEFWDNEADMAYS